MVDVFRKGKSEIKLQGDGEVSWWGVNGIIKGAQETKRVR